MAGRRPAAALAGKGRIGADGWPVKKKKRGMVVEDGEVGMHARPVRASIGAQERAVVCLHAAVSVSRGVCVGAGPAQAGASFSQWEPSLSLASLAFFAGPPVFFFSSCGGARRQRDTPHTPHRVCMQPRTRFILGGTVIAWAAGLQVRCGRGENEKKKRPPAELSQHHPLPGHLGSLTNAHAPSHPAHSQAHMWWLQRQPDFQRAFPAKKEGDE